MQMFIMIMRRVLYKGFKKVTMRVLIYRGNNNQNRISGVDCTELERTVRRYYASEGLEGRGPI